MKKIVGMGLIALAFAACKPIKDVKTQIGLKGEWTLSKVTYAKGFKVTSFHIADAKCFEGSQWKFVSNNNKGTVTLNHGGDCPDFESNIVWTIDKDQKFNLKFVGNEKAKTVTSGYQLDYSNQNENSFQLIDNTSGTKIVYQFEKNNK